MNELPHLLAFLLTSVGATVLVIWPDTGPAAFLRDHVLRPVLPPAWRGVLDCYICLGFWSGLATAAAWWWLMYREPWCWVGPLMTPAAFWLVLRPGSRQD